ncbi:MAG: hypothetical protein ACKOC5_09585 [Chloroflexota bacterium]
MKTRKPVKKPASVTRCLHCRSDNVYYDPGVVRSSWNGDREKTEVGLYTCLDCGHAWRQPPAGESQA